MEENIFNALPGFDRLIVARSFESLPDRERALVLKYITREEYNRYREIALSASRDHADREATIVPDPGVKEKLMQSFGTEARPVRSNRGVLHRVLTYRIPLYQVGMAAAVLLFFVLYALLQTHRMAETIAFADTVYIDRPVRITDTVWCERPGEGSREDVHPAERSNGAPASAYTPVPRENSVYASQMKEALERMSRISAHESERPVHRDTGLMKLVAAGLQAAGE